MRIKDLFLITKPKPLELINTTKFNPCVNFVSRTGENNGVSDCVDIIENFIPYKAGSITVSLGGSVLSSFVQTSDFYTSYHVIILTPKKEMTLLEKLFYCYSININKYRYNYGRQANKTLEDIELPDSIPHWVNEEFFQNIKSSINTKNKSKKSHLNSDNWKAFRVGDLFTLKNCKCSNASLLENGQDTFYIGAKKNNNGVMRTVAYNKELITKGSCIVFICDGQGSVGYSNYIEQDFIGSTTLTVGYNNKLNKYNGLFLVSVLDLERPKYSFGRKYKKYLTNTLIKLPVDNFCKPDWQFMEDYIKQLPYADKI